MNKQIKNILKNSVNLLSKELNLILT